MGHATASGRTAETATPRRTIAESLGISNEELTSRSQTAINNMTQGRLRNYETRQATIVNADTNTMYSVEINNDLAEGRGFMLAVTRYEGSPNAPGGRTPRRIVDHEHFDNARQVRDAIHNATGVPKPQRRRG